MIIVNSNHDDVSTVMVAKWLRHLEKPFLILYEDILMKDICFDLDGNSYFTLNDGRQVFFRDITSYWYRRGQNRFKMHQRQINGELSKLNRRMNYFLREETASFSRFIDFHLSNKKSINNLNSSEKVNKLMLAVIARKAGFKIPATLVTTKKSELVSFVERNKVVITKPIETMMPYSTDNYWLPMYTEEVTEEILELIPNNFSTSLFQQKIEKKYELRVFCLENEKYSMAIFSQRDNQTSVDFRNYNIKKPNRNIPFVLPEKYAKMIDDFMHRSGYNSGSFDILVDHEDNYYFLEINPVGQFGMVSLPCNYYIEKKIAEFL